MPTRTTRRFILQWALLLLCGGAGWAQTTAPAIEWQKSLGGGAWDQTTCIQQTDDSGFIVAGNSSSNDGDVTGHHTGSLDDFWIVKLNAAGVIKWQRCYGGTGNDECTSIQQTKDGGFVVGGQTNLSDGDVAGAGYHGGQDYWVLKLDKSGVIQWSKCYGSSGGEVGGFVEQTQDGGYVVLGNTAGNSNGGDVTANHGLGDYWVVKINAMGVKQWQKSLGGSKADQLLSAVHQTRDRGYIVAGTSRSSDGDVSFNHGNNDYWIVKLDSTGGIKWEKSYGGAEDDFPNSIQQTVDGGYVIAGATQSVDGDVAGNHGYVDGWIVKIDSLGNLQWEKCFGGSGDDRMFDIRQTADGGYIACGESSVADGNLTGSNGSFDYCIIKLDGLGNLIWSKTCGGSGGDEAASIRTTKDGGYIVAGNSNSSDFDVKGNHGVDDIWIVKLAGSPAINSPIISSPQQFSFPPLRCSSVTNATIWIHNIGSKALLLDSATYSGVNQQSLFLSPALPDTVQPGDSLTMTVNVFHNRAGLFSSTLNFFSNDTNNGHNPWTVTFTGREDSVGFTVSGVVKDAKGIVDTIDFGYVSCGTPKDTTFLLTNISTIPSTFYLDRFSSGVVDTLAVAVDSSQRISVHVPAFNFTGEYISWISVTDTCGNVDSVMVSVIVEQPRFTIAAGADTTICPGDSLTRIAIVKNTSHTTQTLRLAAGDPLCTAVPDSLTLASGVAGTITVTFHGTMNMGAHAITETLFDACDEPHTFSIFLQVDTPHISVGHSIDTIICPTTPIVITVPVSNADSVPQQFNVSSLRFTSSIVADTLAAGATDTLILSSPGATIGTSIDTLHVTDICGRNHNVAITIHVQQLPQVNVTIATNAAAIAVGTVSSVAIVANAKAMDVGSTYSFTITNEPTALIFDHVSSPYGITAVSAANAIMLSVVRGPLFVSDTIATLFYKTLVGSTLTPSLRLFNPSTTNTCQTVAALDSATINLLPPGCELGTVLVHPFTSSIQSIYPNPATGETTITYSTIEAAPVSLVVCDALGRTVQTVYQGSRTPGVYSAVFDTHQCTNGMYYVVMREGRFSQAKEIFLVK